MHNASVISLVFTLALAFAGPFELTEQDSPRGKSMGNKITIRIGDKAFAATLSDNSVIESVGERVGRLKVGDEVMAVVAHVT